MHDFTWIGGIKVVVVTVVTAVAAPVGMGSTGPTEVAPPEGATGVVVVEFREPWQMKGAGQSESVAQVVIFGTQDPGYLITVVQVVVSVCTVVVVGGIIPVAPPAPGTPVAPPLPDTVMEPPAADPPVAPPLPDTVMTPMDPPTLGTEMGSTTGGKGMSTAVPVPVPIAVPVAGLETPPVAVPPDPEHTPWQLKPSPHSLSVLHGSSAL